MTKQKTYNQVFRDSIINFVKGAFGASYTSYRFDQRSNFVSHQEYVDENVINALISLGKELERMERFKSLSNDELNEMVNKWQSKENFILADSVSTEQSNAIFNKDKGIEASYEMIRRGTENQE